MPVLVRAALAAIDDSHHGNRGLGHSYKTVDGRMKILVCEQ